MPRRRVDVKMAIMDALSVHGDLTWTGLLKAANVSKGALSSHLKRLMKAGLVERVVADDERPPSVRYRIPSSIRRREPVQAISEEEKLKESIVRLFLGNPHLLDFERMREKAPKLAAQLMEEYFKTNLARLPIRFLDTTLRYLEKFQVEDKLDQIKATPTLEEAWIYIDSLIEEELKDWMEYLAFGLALDFITTSSLNHNLAAPILKDLKKHYEAKYKKEQPTILNLLKKITDDMIVVKVEDSAKTWKLRPSSQGFKEQAAH